MGDRKYRLAALLPMKAHSERVPAKNFRPLAGRPLFRWMLDALLAVEDVELVVINTDARALLAEHGISDGPRILIRDRPQEICGDHVSMNLVIADDLKHVDAETYLMTHTTNPLLKPATVRNAIEHYRRAAASGAADSLFSVTRMQTRFYRADGSAVNHDPDNLIRTQDLEPWFEENSNLYIFSRGSFQTRKARIGCRPVLYETPKLESVDIDDAQDWMVAEALALQRLADTAAAT